MNQPQPTTRKIYEEKSTKDIYVLQSHQHNRGGVYVSILKALLKPEQPEVQTCNLEKYYQPL